MSVFGAQGLLALQALTIENSNGLALLSNNFTTSSNSFSNELNALSNSIATNSNNIAMNASLIEQNADDINTIKNTDLYLVNSNIDVIYDLMADNSNNTESRLLKTDYETLEIAQNEQIENKYLSKQEFNTYNTNKAIEDFIEGGIGNIANSALEEAQLATAVLGATLISTGVTLAGQVYNTVEAAFLNLDGRVIANCNSIIHLENQLETLETSLLTDKVGYTEFTLSNATLSNAVSNLIVATQKRYDKDEIDYFLSDKINGTTFNTFKTLVTASNIRYDADILALQNQSTDVSTNVDFVALSNLVNTSNTIYDITHSNQALSNIRYDNDILELQTDYIALSNTVVANSTAIINLVEDVGEVTGVAASALTLAGTNSALLATANITIGAHTVALTTINTISLPSKVDNDTFNTFLNDNYEELQDRYTKLETNDLLDLKADKSSTYTKIETDTLLSAKVDSNEFNSSNSKFDTFNLYQSMSNTRYNDDISGIQTDFTAFSNTVLTSNVRYDIINSNQALSNLRYNTDVFELQTDLTAFSNTVLTSNVRYDIINSNQALSNIRYDADILQLQNRPIDVSTNIDFITLSNLVNTSNIRYDTIHVNQALSNQLYEGQIASLQSISGVEGALNLERVAVNAFALSIAHDLSLITLNTALTSTAKDLDAFKQGAVNAIFAVYDTISFITSETVIGEDYLAFNLFKETTNNALELKAPIYSPTFTGTISTPIHTDIDTAISSRVLQTVYDSNTSATNVKLNARVLQTVYDSNTTATNANINSRVLQTVYDSNTSATNSNIGIRVLQTVYDSNVLVTNSNISLKAPQVTTYTKTETNDLLFTKLDKSVAISDYATKRYVIDAITTNEGLEEPFGTNAFLLAIATSIGDKILNTALSRLMIDFDVHKTSVASTLQGLLTGLDASLQLTPAGTIIQYAGTAEPYGFLICDGRSFLRADYTLLFNAIGTSWGSVDETSFNIPDLRDRFLRGQGTLAGTVSTVQEDTFASHTHTATTVASGGHSHSGGISSGGSHSHSGNTSANGSHSHNAPCINQASIPFGNRSGFVYASTAAESVGDKSVNGTGNHSHSLNINSGGSHSHGLTIDAVGNHSHTIDVASTGSTETRPKSATVLFCIKF